MFEIEKCFFLSSGCSLRIRQAMFPETMTEGSNVPIPQMDPTVNTAVQRLSQPAELVKNTVVDLINYQVRVNAIILSMMNVELYTCRI